MPGAGFDEASLGLQVRPDQEDLTARFDFNVTRFTLKSQTRMPGTGTVPTPGWPAHPLHPGNNAPIWPSTEASFDEAVKPGEMSSLPFCPAPITKASERGAFVVTEFMMKGDGGVPEFDLTCTTTPPLFYSRPKGDYVGEDGRRSCWTFFPGERRTERGWASCACHHRWSPCDPHALGALFHRRAWAREHTVRLESIDAQGALVPGPFNDSASAPSGCWRVDAGPVLLVHHLDVEIDQVHELPDPGASMLARSSSSSRSIPKALAAESWPWRCPR